MDAVTGKEKWRFHGGEDALIHNQVGFQSSPAVVNGVVFTGCRDSNVYALDAATGQEKWRVNNQGSWVNSSPAVAGGKVYFGTSDSSLFYAVDAATGKPVFKQQLKAYVFSSPSVAGDVVYLGILNGTLEARDRDSGELLWTFQTEASKRNLNWILTAEGKLNSQMFYQSNWHEAPIVATDRQFGIGAIFSAPLVAGGIVYVGSADGLALRDRVGTLFPFRGFRQRAIRLADFLRVHHRDGCHMHDVVHLGAALQHVHRPAQPVSSGPISSAPPIRCSSL